MLSFCGRSSPHPRYVFVSASLFLHTFFILPRLHTSPLMACSFSKGEFRYLFSFLYPFATLLCLQGVVKLSCLCPAIALCVGVLSHQSRSGGWELMLHIFCSILLNIELGHIGLDCGDGYTLNLLKSNELYTNGQF